MTLNFTELTTAIELVAEQEDAEDVAFGCARGSYQRALIDRTEAWSGSSLRGRARDYAGRYRDSRNSLASRLDASGVRWTVVRGDLYVGPLGRLMDEAVTREAEERQADREAELRARAGRLIAQLQRRRDRGASIQSLLDWYGRRAADVAELIRPHLEEELAELEAAGAVGDAFASLGQRLRWDAAVIAWDDPSRAEVTSRCRLELGGLLDYAIITKRLTREEAREIEELAGLEALKDELRRKHGYPKFPHPPHKVLEMVGFCR